MPKRMFLLAALLAAVASPALAAPTIDSAEGTLKKGRKLTVKARVTLSEAGEIRLEGNVNGKPVALRKRVRKARTKQTRFRVSARKLGFRKLARSLEFDLTLRVVENGGSETSRDVGTVVPVPLIVLHGLGSEGTGAMEAFADGLQLLLPGRYEREGKKPSLILHDYESTAKPLETLGRELDRVVRVALRGTAFTKVDMVGESMGGLVIRSYMAEGGGEGRVRNCILLATPNEGAPLAYVGTVAATLLPGLVTLPEGLPEGTEDLVATLLDPEMVDVLEIFYPTYPDWLEADALATFFLPDPTAPLADLNAIAPDAEAEYHFFAYSDTGQTAGDLFGLTVGTVDRIDLTQVDLLALLGGGTPSLDDLPLEAFGVGPGDGLVPLRSALMRDEPGWAGAVVEYDLGVGIHGAMSEDPRAILEVAAILDE